MASTEKKETDNDTEEQEVAFKKKKRPSKPAVRVAAALVGIALAIVAIMAAYTAGKFESSPELPEIMEGEATFTSADGKQEVFHVMIDYKKKLVQLTSLEDPAFSSPLSGRRLMSFEVNNTANGTGINATKIVIQDYNNERKYFVVPEKGNSTTKCIYTALEGDMIPRHLLKHATLKSEQIEGNMTHILFQVDNDTEVDVYRAKGRNGKIYEIYLQLPNSTIHMRSKEKEMNFTDYKQLRCYKYIEENETIEEAFFQSNDSKLYQEADATKDPSVEQKLRQMSSNLTHLLNETMPGSNNTLTQQMPQARRRKRGLGIRGGSIDWWYGNWCGPKQGGYTNNPKPFCKYFCYRSTSYVNRACRDCLPPRDGLDEACMEHDRCLIYYGGGPWWCQPWGNRCKCDSPFVWRAFTQIWRCPTWTCRIHALQVFVAFNLLSCWFPIRICFPWIRFVCGCKWCACPRIIVYLKCIVFKMCAFFGSGKFFG